MFCRYLMTRAELLGKVYNAAPELRRMVHSVTDIELEKHCSPSIYLSSPTELSYSNKAGICYGLV